MSRPRKSASRRWTEAASSTCQRWTFRCPVWMSWHPPGVPARRRLSARPCSHPVTQRWLDSGPTSCVDRAAGFGPGRSARRTDTGGSPGAEMGTSSPCRRIGSPSFCTPDMRSRRACASTPATSPCACASMPTMSIRRHSRRTCAGPFGLAGTGVRAPPVTAGRGCSVPATCARPSCTGGMLRRTPKHPDSDPRKINPRCSGIANSKNLPGPGPHAVGGLFTSGRSAIGATWTGSRGGSSSGRFGSPG